MGLLYVVYMDVLKRAGLTEGEVKVYLALINHGESTIGQILKNSRVTKSIIYSILDKLIEKGLVSFVLKNEIRHFQAASPNTLLDYLDKKSKEIDSTKKEIEEIIPSLLAKRDNHSLNQASIYEGWKGIISAYIKRFEKLKKGEEYLNLGLPAKQVEHHHIFWQKDHQERVKRGIKAKLLYNKNVSDDVLKNRNSFKLCDARRMPTDINTPSWILIYKDTVLIAIPESENPLAIEIVNKDIAESFSLYFRDLWEKSKPFGKK